MADRQRKTLDHYRKKIIALLSQSGQYKPGLSPHILALATAMRNLERINADLDNLESCTYPEKTAYGTRIQENPLFGMAHKQMQAIARAAKPLGLDCDKLMNDTESDPLVELTDKLIDKEGKSPEIVKPRKA